MTTVSGTFTTESVSSTLRLGKAVENVSVSLTGPFDATVALERFAGHAWERVAGPWDGSASVSAVYVSGFKDRLRLRCFDVDVAVTNGTFASATGWTVAGAWSIGSGVATRTASASDVNMDTTIAAGLVAGASYVVAFDMTRSAGSMTVSLGGGTASAAQNSTGAKSLTLVAGSSNATLRFIADSTFAGTVDNVTITPTFTYSFSDGDATLREFADPDGNVLERVTQAGHQFFGTVAISGTATVGGETVQTKPDVQDITAAGAINLDARHVRITGPSSSTYAVTLAAPTEAGIVKVIEMIATTSTNAVTLALTNVIGGSAATTATFNAADEVLTLVSANDKWVVLNETGVTLA